jgi:hypothetical protein
VGEPVSSGRLDWIAALASLFRFRDLPVAVVVEEKKKSPGMDWMVCVENGRALVRFEASVDAAPYSSQRLPALCCVFSQHLHRFTQPHRRKLLFQKSQRGNVLLLLGHIIGLQLVIAAAASHSGSRLRNRIVLFPCHWGPHITLLQDTVFSLQQTDLTAK